MGTKIQRQEEEVLVLNILLGWLELTARCGMFYNELEEWMSKIPNTEK